MPVLFNLLHVIPTQGTKCKMNLSRESHVKVFRRLCYQRGTKKYTLESQLNPYQYHVYYATQRLTRPQL